LTEVVLEAQIAEWRKLGLIIRETGFRCKEMVASVKFDLLHFRNWRIRLDLKKAERQSMSLSQLASQESIYFLGTLDIRLKTLSSESRKNAIHRS
jgi:hypothetical protein